MSTTVGNAALGVPQNNAVRIQWNAGGGVPYKLPRTVIEPSTVVRVFRPANGTQQPFVLWRSVIFVFHAPFALSVTAFGGDTSPKGRGKKCAVLTTGEKCALGSTAISTVELTLGIYSLQTHPHNILHFCCKFSCNVL